MTTLDLNILPIRRANGQESPEIPGLLAVTPPRKTARGREQTSLIVYLTLSGNSALPNAELRQLTHDAVGVFHQSPGSMTFAMRAVANEINARLLARNLSHAGQGQQVVGWLVLAAIRENQCTLLLSGPTHAVWVTDGGSRHVHDLALSGKGLGLGQNISTYLSQVELRPQDLLVLCGLFPRDWEADLLNERPPASLDASYRKLTFAKGDLNAVLIQAQSGHGTITLLRPEPKPAHAAAAQPASSAETVPSPAGEQPLQAAAPTDKMPQSEPTPLIEEEVSTQHIESPVQDDPIPDYPSPISEVELDALADFGAHLVQPSAYAIPPQTASAPPYPKEEVQSNGGRSFPASIPRAKPAGTEVQLPVEEPPDVEIDAAPLQELETVEPAPRPRRRRRRLNLTAHAAATRQMARAMVGGIRTGRRANERLRTGLQRFIPRILPSGEPNKPLSLSTVAMVLIAIIIPIIVVTMASMVYLRLGQSIQYDELYGQALNARAQAVSETDPARQRDAWQRVLVFLNKADEYRVPEDSRALRAEAQANLDNVMGIIRLEFMPAFPNGLGGSAQISRMAASESDLYMLDSESGKILHASFTGRSLELDNSFNCQPGSYGGYQVTELVDIVALPKVNTLNATVLGVDANGNLLYCAPDQVSQAIPLPSLPNTNWGRVTSITLDSGNLYVLDAQKRSVWVFPGKDSAFVDSPFFYFGNEIPASIDSAIDLAVTGDDLYLLRADGQIATCKFSRLSEVPTRCQDPAPRVDKNPAHVDIDIFQLAHFTQIAVTNPPNSVILLLDSDNQSVYRFSPRSFELQNQITGQAGKASPFQRRTIHSMAVSPNYVLYLAIGDQVYFATNVP
ncbi:MAG TPA: hypothetical protein VFY25_09590 [Anaerolineales bacterium]|nr:hypothetical protein [Anaerolineales bacterium]